VLVPRTLPIFNYAQAMVLGASTESTLRTMDADWARIAFRAPIPSTGDATGDASGETASGETEESAP
jgi:raffinose/stachyose/melibiose transport system substrate-binding protein